MGTRSIRVDNHDWPWKAGREGPNFFQRTFVRMLVPFDQQRSYSAC